jgi:hypothetical protein
VRGALANAQSIGELDSAARAEAKRITGRDIEFAMGGDLQVAKEHVEGVMRGLERYPNTGLERVEQGGSRWGESQEAWAETTLDGSVISFTNDAQRYGAEGYRAELKQAKRGGDMVPGTPMGVAMHEFGHSAANSYNLNGWANNKASHYAEIEMGIEDVGTASSKAISKRSAENTHELSAEAFADVMTNGSKASGMSKAIVDFFDSEIAAIDAAADEEE